MGEVARQERLLFARVAPRIDEIGCLGNYQELKACPIAT